MRTMKRLQIKFFVSRWSLRYSNEAVSSLKYFTYLINFLSQVLEVIFSRFYRCLQIAKLEKIKWQFQEKYHEYF